MSSSESVIPKITVLGIGGAGLKVLKVIASLTGSEWLNLAVADTDEEALNRAGIDASFAIGTDWTNGAGCGGNPVRGQNAFSHESNKELEKFISGSSILIVVAGLGMGTGTGGAPIIGRMAKRLKIPSIFILTTPFEFEGQGKSEIAKDGLKLLISNVDIAVPISNDILFTALNAEVPVKEAFLKSDNAIAHATLGLAEVFRCGDLLPVGFAELKELLENEITSCCLGMGLATQENSEDRVKEALENFMDSPLMPGEKKLKNADAIITTVIGGDDLQIGELKEVLGIIAGMAGPATKIVSGVNTDSAYNGKMFVTTLIINYTNRKKKEKEEQPALPLAPWDKNEQVEPTDDLVQPELLFNNSLSRGYFAKTDKNIVDGEDIDIPPHQRKGITLNTGL